MTKREPSWQRIAAVLAAATLLALLAVSQALPTVVAQDLPQIQVAKAAKPDKVPATGGTVTYQVKVRNEHPGGLDVTVDRMQDNVYGNLTNPGNANVSNNTCTQATIAAGDTYQCTFDAEVSGNPGSSVTDTVTVRVSDANGNRVEASAEATVAIEGAVMPVIQVAKAARPDTVPATGGTVTYQVKVRNQHPGGLEVTLDRMQDNLYGNLTNPGNSNISNSTCTLVSIAAGDTYQCTFDAEVSGNPGSSVTDTVTVRVSDANGNRVEASAEATVAIEGAVMPVIQVAKAAKPDTVPATGGTVTYQVKVRNQHPGGLEVTLDRMQDNLYGNLTNPGNRSISNSTCTLASIAAGDTYQCTFDAEVAGNPGSSVTDTVTVRVSDANGNRVEASAEATVAIEGAVMPVIQVAKAARPDTVPATGGTVTYQVKVRNQHPGGLGVTVDRIHDDRYGNLTNPGNRNVSNNTCTLVSIAAGDTYQCTFDAEVAGNPGSSVTDTVTVRVSDANGNRAEASAEATVAIEGAVMPVIQVAKAASPEKVPAPGGTVTYQVKVRNQHPGDLDVTVDRMQDNRYGNLTNPGNRSISNSTCTLVSIAAGDTYQCTFDAEVSGNPGSSVTDTVTVQVSDANGNRAEASAQATVAIGAGGAPQIEVAKVPKPDEVPASGGTVTYQVKVRNRTTLVLRLLRMHDNLYGNLTNPGNSNISNSTCTLATIQGGATYQCTFDARVTGSPGSSVTDVVTVRAEDPSGARVEDSAQATVRIGPGELPQIAVSKSADPKQILDPGGTVTYRVRVRNESPGTVTLIGIRDNLYGDLTDSGNSLIANSTCRLVGIPRGDTYNCTFKAQVTGIAGTTVIDLVRVRAEDAAGNRVEGSAEAKVEIVGKPPPTGVPLPPPAIFGGLLGLGLAALLGGALMHGRSLRPG